MLGCKSFLRTTPISSLPAPSFNLLPKSIFPSLSSPLKPPSKFHLSAKNNNGNNNDNLSQEPNNQNQQQKNGSSKNGSLFNNFNWGALLMDPDPDNILAVGLTCLLTWASVQVLLQLIFVSLAILVAALNGNVGPGPLGMDIQTG